MTVGALTFKQIVDGVLSDRFPESMRVNAKEWVNHRYWWVWALEPWAFKMLRSPATLISGAELASVAATFQRIHEIFMVSGTDYVKLTAVEPEDLLSGSSAAVGTPSRYSEMGGQSGPVIRFDCPVASSTSFEIVGERIWLPLQADGDEPLLPLGSHFALVHGGAAEGLKLQNDPTWQAFEEDFQASLTILRNGYLQGVTRRGAQVPAYRG